VAADTASVMSGAGGESRMVSKSGLLFKSGREHVAPIEGGALHRSWAEVLFVIVDHINVMPFSRSVRLSDIC
jgi:hypothetical protein